MSPYRTNPPSVWPGIYEGMPEELKAALSDPAFSIEDVTFCIWRTRENNCWAHGDITFPHPRDADGSANLLAVLDDNPQSYQEWAEKHYESGINLAAVERIYSHEPLSSGLVTALNSEITLEDLAEDITEIGYPSKRG